MTIENSTKFLSLFEGEPDFVNEIGTKWWKDELTTQYAQRPGKQGIPLMCTCYALEMVDGYKMRVLVDVNGNIIEEDQSLEGLACKIDVRKFLLNDN